MALTDIPAGVKLGPNGVFMADFHCDSDTMERSLPRSILLLSGENSMVAPFQVLWETGASHSILSPAAARRLGYAVPESPDGHGSMKVASGASTSIYGWTSAIRVKPPRHLQASDGSRARITALPPLR